MRRREAFCVVHLCSGLCHPNSRTTSHPVFTPPIHLERRRKATATVKLSIYHNDEDSHHVGPALSARADVRVAHVRDGCWRAADVCVPVQVPDHVGAEEEGAQEVQEEACVRGFAVQEREGEARVGVLRPGAVGVGEPEYGCGRAAGVRKGFVEVLDVCLYIGMFSLQNQ